MKLLLDANRSPSIRNGLTAAGHETAHVSDVELLHADDETILAYAANNEAVLVTADHDFAALLALSGARRPSVKDIG